MSAAETANWFLSRSLLADWYATALGREVDAAVAAAVERCLADSHGERGLQVGATARSRDLLAAARLGHRMYLCADGNDGLTADPEQLPLASDSINLLVLCHVIEFHQRPQAVLAEAERVLRGEGRVLLIAFNAWSLLGLCHWLKGGAMPEGVARMPGVWQLRTWCRSHGLELEHRGGCWRRPPVHNPRVRQMLAWMERGHRVFDRWGGIQILRLEKRRTPFNPIPLQGRWRRELGARPSNPEPTARVPNRHVAGSGSCNCIRSASAAEPVDGRPVAAGRRGWPRQRAGAVVVD